MANGEGIGGLRIPAALAVAAWFASALAVTGYTVIAFIETSSGTPSINASPPGRGPVKKLLPKLSGKGLDQLDPLGITPKDLGFTQGTVKPPRQKFTPSKDASRRKFKKQK